VIEKMAHVTLTALCKHCLTGTADTPIALFPIWNQDESKWRQCLEAVCDLTSLYFSTD
jgi:hypothetical protein